MRRSRDERAINRKSAYGREVAAGQWATAEWNYLVRLWQAGVPVPYPVQSDGAEILMEWITADGETASRLAQTRPAADLLAAHFEQLCAAMTEMTTRGLVHGDLSAYNILVADRGPVLIDVPQMIDLAGNQNALDFLMRDCINVCTWFRARGLASADEQTLFADMVARAT
jgi:RIO kinase 1